MKRWFLPALIALVLLPGASKGQTPGTPSVHQTTAFTSSDLPIVLIETEGVEIPDDPKLTARMAIIDNGPGVRNLVTDTPTGYDGWIGIERRGSSSQQYPKKSYGFETRDATGESSNVVLLGFPKENDWILYAPYDDKTLLRNEITFWIARRMGRYGSRTRFCELVLNGSYQGVYMLMEKIKVDKNRVAVEGLEVDDLSGDAVTGGYIFKIDKTTGSSGEGWVSPYKPTSTNDRVIYYQYDDPDPEDLAPEQQEYLRNAVTRFEESMALPTYSDPVNGYRKYADLGSFVDYFIVTELARNVDGYRLSAFLHKDRDSKGGKIIAGPLWDFNFGFGNADYYNGASTSGLQVDFQVAEDTWQVPFWWPRMARDTAFVKTLTTRWCALRNGVLHTDTLIKHIDDQVALLAEAQPRNHEKWPVVGTYVWANAYVGQTYTQDVNYLKSWISDRVQWLDDEILISGLKSEPPGGRVVGCELADIHPNPVQDRANLTLRLGSRQEMDLSVFDVLGRRVLTLYTGPMDIASHLFTLDTGNIPSGSYYIVARGITASCVEPISVVH